MRASRRKFLKLAVAAGAGALVGPHLAAGAAHAFVPEGARDLLKRPLKEDQGALGRAITHGLHVHPEPVVQAPDVRYLAAHEVVHILESVEGEAWLPHNPTWYRLEDGYVYSSWVQPVANRPQPPLTVPSEGWWGEVSVPLVEARAAPDRRAGAVYAFPYATVFRVVEARHGSDGTIWYRVLDEEKPWPEWVPSYAIGRLTAADFAPIRPEVEDKRIEVDLSRFRITALEGGQPVLAAPIATGAVFQVAGERVDFRTPSGAFRVLWKRPSRHMIGGTRGESDYFDLPGVPWCTYLTWSGVAIHGTYWHNDYGRQRSHGCINVTPEVARFFYRWTRPTAPYEASLYRSSEAEEAPTPIHIHA